MLGERGAGIMGRPKGGTNRRWTTEEKVRLIEEYYKSEIGYKTFAQEKGIAHSLFAAWLKRYQEGGVNSLRHSKRKVPENISLGQDMSEEFTRLKLIIAEQQIQIEELKRQLKEV